MTARRTPLVLVTGLDRTLTAAAGAPLLDRPGTVVVQHDVSALHEGVVVRTVRERQFTGVAEHTAAVELAHRYWPANRRWRRAPACNWSASPPIGRSPRSGCTRRSTSCWTAC